MQAEYDVLVEEVRTGIDAEAAAGLGAVISPHRCTGIGERRASGQNCRSRRRWTSEVLAGEYAILETIREAEDLVRRKTGIKGDFGDEIGRRIEPICGSDVVGIARAGLHDHVVVRVSGSGCCGLSILYRECNCDLATEVLGHAKCVLTREGESDVIRAVDGRGPRIVGSAGVVAGSDSNLAFGEQTPHLASEDAPTPRERSLPPRLPDAEGVAIRLSRR